MAARGAAPGLWVKRIGLGEPVRRRRARVQATARVRAERRPSEGAPMPEQVRAAGTQSAPGHWAARRTLGAMEASVVRAGGVGAVGTAAEGRAARIGRAENVVGEAASGARVTEASGVEEDARVGVARAAGGTIEAAAGRSQVRLDDARAEQRARVEAAR